MHLKFQINPSGSPQTKFGVECNGFVTATPRLAIIWITYWEHDPEIGHAEFEREATWATRKYVPFVMQRISVAVQIAAATEIRQALGRGVSPDSA
jgi:hypothetical protein